MKYTTATLLLAGFTSSAFAAPGFDRPGTAFNPQVLDPGSIVWEQGLPDITRNEANGITETLYEYDSRLRLGVSRNLEVQVFGNPYAQLRTSGHGHSDTIDGPGNTGVAVKLTLPTQSPDTQLGVMASAEFNTGKAAFRNYDRDGDDHNSYYLGVTGSRDLSDSQSAALYLDVTRVGDDNVYTFSPSWSTALNDRWGAYLEYKVAFGDVDDNDHLAGGGVTWMVTDRLQLDLFSDFGVTSDSTDYESGFGVAYLIR